jgi:tripartite-type tricarboxylate transporter receptor subunit TctC
MASDPQVMQAWAKQGATPMKMSPDAFSKYMQDDIAKWARIVKLSGAKADR